MKPILSLVITALLIFPAFSHAETKEIIAEGAYNIGDGETPTVAESRALLQAKRTAVEEAGTYVTTTLALIGCATFALLGLWHFYWAFGGSIGKAAAIPEVNGAPAFTPSAAATVFVGIALLSFAVLVAATSGFVAAPVPGPILVWLCNGLALVLLARAVGEFRLVGFFKRVRGSAFARLDTWVYSPLCLILSCIVFTVANSNVA